MCASGLAEQSHVGFSSESQDGNVLQLRQT